MLQHAEEKRIMKLADHLAAYSDAEHQVQGNVSVCLENMTTATRAIDYQIVYIRLRTWKVCLSILSLQDVKAVIDELKTGYKPPEDIQFEMYKSGAKAKKMKKAPPKAKKVEFVLFCLFTRSSSRRRKRKTLVIFLLPSERRNCWKRCASLTREWRKRCRKSKLIYKSAPSSIRLLFVSEMLWKKWWRCTRKIRHSAIQRLWAKN